METRDDLVVMPNLDKYIKFQESYVHELEKRPFMGYTIKNLKEYLEYREINLKLIEDLFLDNLNDYYIFAQPSFHLVQANHAIMINGSHLSEAIVKYKEDNWISGYVLLHFYADYFEILRMEYSALGKKIRKESNDELPFTSIARAYPYTEEMFEGCINKFRNAPSHLQYLIDDNHKIYLYHKDSMEKEEVNFDIFLNNIMKMSVVHISLITARIKARVKVLRSITEKISESEASEIDKSFEGLSTEAPLKKAYEFLDDYKKKLGNNKKEIDS